MLTFTGNDSYTFKDTRDGLRGGTPFVLYRYPYYISVAHGTYFRDCRQEHARCHGKRYYTTHLILITIEPVFRIVYVSGNIPYPEASLQLPLVRYRFIESTFFFPVGLILENPDSLIIGGHINDHSSCLYRLGNIATLLDSSINVYEKHPNKAALVPGVLQDYTRSMAQKYSGMQFQSG